MAVVCLAMEGRRPEHKPGRLLDFKPVLANREALGYIFGYGAHCFELYGVRTWLVGFWTYVIAHQGAPSWMSPVVVSFVFAVVSMPASILGNEAALKFGRHRAITAVMVRVLLTSGYADGVFERHGAVEEFEVIAKPFRRADLAQRLRLVLQG
jgi:hypothetical protein